MQALIERLAARLAGPGPYNDGVATPAPPLDATEVTQVEATLGRPLSPLLREVVTQVGDGGFGYAYGHLGLHRPGVAESTAVDLWEALRRPNPADPHWAWPAALLPFVELGCGMYLCVDLDTPDAAIVWFEPNPHETGEPWTEAFIPLGIGLETLLCRWLDGDDLLDVFESA